MVSKLKGRKPVSSLDAFICYSRSDGSAVAKTLAEKLKACDYRIKLDSKNVTRMDVISSAKYAIVILSPGFFRDSHAMATLERLIGRQMEFAGRRGEPFILPLWHDVDERQVFESWPQMTDIFGLKTSIGVPAIVQQFRNKIILASPICTGACKV